MPALCRIYIHFIYIFIYGIVVRALMRLFLPLVADICACTNITCSTFSCCDGQLFIVFNQIWAIYSCDDDDDDVNAYSIVAADLFVGTKIFYWSIKSMKKSAIAETERMKFLQLPIE